MLATALLLVFAQASPRLDDWVLRAERVVLGRVERVLEVEQRSPRMLVNVWRDRIIRVAEVRVERAFMAPADEERLYVVDEDFVRARSTQLVPGERGLFFLDRDRRFWMHASEGTKRALAEATGGAPVREAVVSREPARQGVGRFSSGERVPAELLEEFTAGGGSPELEPFLARLEQSLARSLPALEVHYATTGPKPWGLRIGPDRKVRHGGAPEQDVSEEEWRALWSLAGEVAFRDLPENVGAMSGPCESFFLLVLRERTGPKLVRCFAGNPTKDAAYSEQVARFRRLWEALPGAEKPSLEVLSEAR